MKNPRLVLRFAIARRAVEAGLHAANSCLVYNYYSSVSKPTSCTVPAPPQDGSVMNNGNVMGYYYLDNTNTNITHWATET